MQLPAISTSVYVITGSVSQLSVAVAYPVNPGSAELLHARVVSAGHDTTGGVVSKTVMVCTQVLILPQASADCQVLRIRAFPVQAPGVLESVYEISGAGSQLSIAVALPVTEGSEALSQLMVMSAGQLITGAVVS